MNQFIVNILESNLYLYAMIFLALFPVIIAGLAVNSSREFYIYRSSADTEKYLPHLEDLNKAKETWPTITIVIPARNEEKTILKTLDHSLKINWPNLEIIVINDGSTDNTNALLNNYKHKDLIKIISHQNPLGKSISLNEGIKAAISPIVLIMDADAVPASNILERLTPHFLMSSEVIAVTGNPRVLNTENFLTKLQAIEFTSTISTLRRGQSAWGRVNTFSGICTALRRDETLALGGFSPTQPTEDIELTWRLHRNGFRCIYEPAAQVGMQVPSTIRKWFKQRIRWASGLVRVLQAHGFAILKEWKWPMFPILLEAALAIVWCHLLIAATIFWAIALTQGISGVGNSLIIGHWGSMTIGIALFQILWGMHLDSNHDKNIVKLWWLAPFYPIIYWWLSAIVVVVSTIPSLMTRPKTSTWSIKGS